MNLFRQFRRCLLLLLSLTLSAQAMAVASFGACHRAKPLASVEMSVSASRQHHGDSVAHQAGERNNGHHSADSVANGYPKDGGPQDASRVKCAACAACHLCSVVLTNETVAVDIPAGESTSFPQVAVPRVRNVANGLERPPRA